MIVLPQERWGSALLCRFSKTKCCRRQGFIHTSKDGIIYWLTWRCSSTSDGTNEPKILGTWSRWRLRQSSIHVASQSLPLRSHVIRAWITPGTFQSVINVVVAPLRRQSSLVYLDDLIFFPKSQLEHIEHVCQVLRLLSGSEATLNCKSTHYLPMRSTISGALSALPNWKLQCTILTQYKT